MTAQDIQAAISGALGARAEAVAAVKNLSADEMKTIFTAAKAGKPVYLITPRAGALAFAKKAPQILRVFETGPRIAAAGIVGKAGNVVTEPVAALAEEILDKEQPIADATITSLITPSEAEMIKPILATRGTVDDTQLLTVLAA